MQPLSGLAWENTDWNLFHKLACFLAFLVVLAEKTFCLTFLNNLSPVSLRF